MAGTEPPIRAGATLEIDLDAVIANWQTLRRQHATGAVAAVVKADAYGLGTRSVVPALHAAGCRHFFVASLDEALAIRDFASRAMIAVVNGAAPGSEPHAAPDTAPLRQFGGHLPRPALRTRPRPTGSRPLRHQPDAGARQSDANHDAPDRTRTAGAGDRGG